MLLSRSDITRLINSEYFQQTDIFYLLFAGLFQFLHHLGIKNLQKAAQY